MRELLDVEHTMRRDAPVNNNKKPRSRAIQLKKTTPYAVRKERKQILAEQAATMQKKLDELKLRMLVEQGGLDYATKRKQAENFVLHKFIQEQHLALASTQASLNGQVQRSLGNLQPVQCVIRLGTSQVERYKTLLILKDRKLDEAERYLATRCQEVEPGASYRQRQRFETADGDQCLVMFEALTMRGARPKAIFDAILGTVFNSEIFLSELFGSVTIREDSDFDSAELAQLRMVSLTSSGAMVESNTIVFSKFVDGEDGGHGVLAGDFVDFDELYPYRSNERVRRDSTTICMARSLPHTHGTEPQVMVSRWTCLKIHSSNTAVSRDPEVEMKESSMCWGDSVQKCVLQQLMETEAGRANSP